MLSRWARASCVPGTLWRVANNESRLRLHVASGASAALRVRRKQLHTKQQPQQGDSAAVVEVRRSDDRGYAHHGWLETYHTFAFASYHDSRFRGFRGLRVINEDRLKGGTGFVSHSHDNFEIFSYVIEGALEHRDSLNNREVIRRGDVQFTSAGRGVSHSEYNHSPKDPVHFIQIWVKPNERDTEPRYTTRHFDDRSKLNRLVPVVAGDSRGNAIPVLQDMVMYATLLDPASPGDGQVQVRLEYGGNSYVHVVQRERSQDVLIDGRVRLAPGDGAFITNAQSYSLAAAEPVQQSPQHAQQPSRPAEVLVFDLS